MTAFCYLEAILVLWHTLKYQSPVIPYRCIDHEARALLVRSVTFFESCVVGELEGLGRAKLRPSESESEV